MFKKIFLASVLFALVVPVASVNAQYWTLSGSNINNVNSGNVGIGTAFPASKLDVHNGSVRVGNNYAYTVLDPSGTTRVAFQMDTLGNQLVGAGTVSTGGDLVLRAQGFPGGAMYIKANSGNVGIGVSNPFEKLRVDGLIGAKCSAGLIVTPQINAIGWYSQAATLASGCNIGNFPRIVLTQDNSGTGDISIISFRVKKNSVTPTGFSIEYYVNAVPTPGSTFFNFLIISG